MAFRIIYFNYLDQLQAKIIKILMGFLKINVNSAPHGLVFLA